MTVAATIAQQRMNEAASIKEQIMKLLHWDEMQYCEYQYTNGIAYLYWYLPCDEDARKQLEGSKLYWNWFKNQWTIHDEALLTYTAFINTDIKLRRESYQCFHCPRALAAEVKPNDIVLNEIKTKTIVHASDTSET